MAEDKKNDAPEEVPAGDREESKSFYLLKAGVQHTEVLRGDMNTITGDGSSVMLELTDNQAKAFADKLAGGVQGKLTDEQVKGIRSQTRAATDMPDNKPPEANEHNKQAGSQTEA